MHIVKRPVGWLNRCVELSSIQWNARCESFRKPRGRQTRIVKGIAKATTNPFPTQQAMHPNLVDSYKIIGKMRSNVIHGDACTQTCKRNLSTP